MASASKEPAAMSQNRVARLAALVAATPEPPGEVSVRLMGDPGAVAAVAAALEAATGQALTVSGRAPMRRVEGVRLYARLRPPPPAGGEGGGA
jgi:hypothetical protein